MDDRVFVLCVDHSLDEDLLFWQSFIREVSATGSHPPMFIVLGSTERCARNVEAAGGTARRNHGILGLESPVQREAFERAVRDDGRRIVQQFSDSGISSVGFAGFDRGILNWNVSGNLNVSRVESMTAWCRSGVIPVLVCSARNIDGEILDIHPALVCKSVVEEMSRNEGNQMGDMVLLLSKLSGNLAEKIDSSAPVTLDELVENDALPDPSYLSLLVEIGSEVLVTHVSRLANMRTSRVVNRKQ